jgi:hypothetical protein
MSPTPITMEELDALRDESQSRRDLYFNVRDGKEVCPCVEDGHDLEQWRGGEREWCLIALESEFRDAQDEAEDGVLRWIAYLCDDVKCQHAQERHVGFYDECEFPGCQCGSFRPSVRRLYPAEGK